MKLLEMFENFTSNSELKNLASVIEVDKLVVSQVADSAVLKCFSNRIIHPSAYQKLEYALNSAYFSGSGQSISLEMSFPFEKNKEAEYLWNTYGSLLIDAVGIQHRYESYVASQADVSFTGNTVVLDIEDNFISRQSSKDIVNYFQATLKTWFDADVRFEVTYHKPAKSEYDGNLGEGYEIFDPEKYKRSKPDYVPGDLKGASGEASGSNGKSDKGYGKKNDLQKSGSYFKKRHAADPDVFYGHDVEGEYYAIADLADYSADVVIKGMIMAVDMKELRNGKILFMFNVTDFEDTISVKIFCEKEELEQLKGELKPNGFVIVKGRCIMDTFKNELGISSVRGIKHTSDFRVKRRDMSESKRVELHAHTQMSDMDAVTNVASYVKTAFEWGHNAVAITDHGVVQAFPEASHALNPKDYKDDPEKLERLKKFKIIYGCEGYLVNDDDLFDGDGNALLPEKEYTEEICKRKYYHIILLCKNDLGRSNLYKLVSDSHLKFFRRRPRIPKSLLQKNREGIIIGSACEAGELFRAILNKESEEYIEKISKLYDYYEIQPTGNNAFLLADNEKYPEIKTERDLQELNRRVIELSDKHGKLCVATCDVHFLNPEDEIYRRIIMAGKGFTDADRQPPLYFRTTEEMLAEFSYLSSEKAFEICVENTNKIADMIEKIAPVRPDKCPPVIENSDNDLRQMCYEKAMSMYGRELPEIVKTRLDKELNSIISNGYSVMYIIAQKLVKKSNDDGYLVGSRGSVGSSFVATMSGITEVNPLPPHYYCMNCHYTDFDSDAVREAIENQLSGYDLPDAVCPKCGRRLFRDGQNIPFETFLGFYGDKEPDIDLNFSGEYQTKAHAYTEIIFGEGHTFKAGTIGTLADKTAFGFIKKYYEERGIQKREAEIDRIVKGCVGVRRTTGQHPGGIVVLPHGEEIYTFTPVQHPANDMTSNIITTHFDYHSIDHNLLKLDILGHDDPTMIRFLEDLTGKNAKEWPMDDPKVISLFQSCEALGVTKEQIGCELGSLGLPELGTNFVMNMLKETKPKNFSDMIRISGLSHGTDVWTNNAQELVKNGKCTLSTAICTRDDIMTYLILKGIEAGTSFKIMESVRKGKGLTEEMEKVMVENNIPDWYIWSCKKIKYMFPKAHACAYVMMAFRIAYCKVYYPLAYYAAYFSIRADNFDYEMMAQGLSVLQKNMDMIDSRINSKTATPKEEGLKDDMMLVREMYCRGIEFMPIDIYRAKANRFQIIDGKLMPSLSTIGGMGSKAADMVESEAQKAPFVSRNEFKNRCKVPATVVEVMNKLGLFGNLPEDDQLSFFDMLSGT